MDAALESSGVLREAEAGARGQRRYIAYEMLAAVRGLEA